MGGAIVREPTTESLTRISTDSRTIQPGDLFVALSGENFDGHNYLTEVAAKGAAAVVIESGRRPAELPSCGVIEVTNARGALGKLAAAYRAQGSPLVICGDLNIARAEIDIHPKERKLGGIGQRPEERALFQRVLDDGGLVDVGRAVDPANEGLFTWWAPWRNLRQRNIGWRLDYLLATHSVFEKVSRCTVQRDFGTSDHAPVVAEYAIGVVRVAPEVMAPAPPPPPPPDSQGSLF